MVRIEPQETDFTAEPLPALIGLKAALRRLMVELDESIEQKRAAGLPATTEPVRAIRIEEAAPLMGLTYGYAIRHWQRLGAFKDSDGRVKFPTSVVRARAGGAAPSGA